MNRPTDQQKPDSGTTESNDPWLQDASSQRRLLRLALGIGAVVGFIIGIAVATLGTTNVNPAYMLSPILALIGAISFGLLSLILTNMPARQARVVALYLIRFAGGSVGVVLVAGLLYALGMWETSQCLGLILAAFAFGAFAQGAERLAPRIANFGQRLLQLNVKQ